MRILGVHVGHDSGAALVVDGAVVADMSEERVTRVKHYSGLPVGSVRFCLDHARLSIDDIDVVAVPSAAEPDDPSCVCIHGTTHGVV